MNRVFDLVYADPPWRYDFAESDSRKIENQYPTMTVEEISAIDVPAATDSVLYMWATAPKLVESLTVMKSWGFEYRSCAVWDKEIPGMGYWFRGQHELLLVGVRGKMSPPSTALRVPSVYRQARGRHSKKPAHFWELLAAWYPDVQRLEMFCRYPSPGWSAWGNQVDSSAALLEPARYDPVAARLPGQEQLFGAAS